MSARIIVFAKAPVAGRAKTRLIPALGAEGAAALAERLLEYAVGAAVEARLGEVELCVTPDGGHPAFLALQSRHELALTLQGDGDLGARMDRALTRALGSVELALLIGTDAPALDAARLRAVAQELATADAVCVPTFDGGYALVGLRRPAPELFAGMSWSTAQVMQATRARAAAAGLRLIETAPLTDIDEPADLAHLPADW